VRCDVGIWRRTQDEVFAVCRPGEYNGEKAVFVDGRLGEIEPMAYRFMLNFAQDNDLQIIDGVCSIADKN
jgi:hypothetical protein